ncbi:MAG: hypothetical protein MUC43_08235 [Pirellula sp.]|jgi:hypothetical protein|nr:hypothetical protein [Pirellula sp.]
MSRHPSNTPASPSLASWLFDATFDSIESLTTTFSTSARPTLETTTVTEVALGYHRNGQYSITAMTTSTSEVAECYAFTAYGQPTILSDSGSPIGNQQSQIANRFTYTDREWDETLGLHHFRARWMSLMAIPGDRTGPEWHHDYPWIVKGLKELWPNLGTDSDAEECGCDAEIQDLVSESRKLVQHGALTPSGLLPCVGYFNAFNKQGTCEGLDQDMFPDSLGCAVCAEVYAGQ